MFCNVGFYFDKFVLSKSYNLKNKIFKSLNFLIIYPKYSIYLSFMQARNRKLMFHEVSILCIFKSLLHNRLKIEKCCAFFKTLLFKKMKHVLYELCKDATTLFQLIVYDCLICSNAYIYISIHSFYPPPKKKIKSNQNKIKNSKNQQQQKSKKKSRWHESLIKSGKGICNA